MSIPGHRFQFSFQYLLVLFISSKKCLKEDEKYFPIVLKLFTV